MWYVTVRYTLEQRVFLYDTYVKYASARKCRRKFRRKFRDERVPSRQAIHSLMDKKQNHKHRVLTEQKSDDIRLEHARTPRKSLNRLGQETGVSKSSARTATQIAEV
jgi:hypothetical protein